MQSILEHVFTSRLAFFRTTSGLVYIYEDVYNSPISSSMSEVTYFMFFCLRCHRPQPEYLKSKWGADLHKISFLDFF